MNHTSKLIFLLLCIISSMTTIIASKPIVDNINNNNNNDVIEFDIGKQNTPIQALAPWHVHVWAPSSTANTETPSKVMLFASGFAGFMAVTDYSNILSSISSTTNTVVIGLDRKFKLPSHLTVNYTNLAYTSGEILEYVENGSLMKELQTNGFKGTLDSTNYIFGAHSAGNHLSVRRMVTYQKCNKFTSMIMIDPVDGEDPSGKIKEYVIHPPAKVNFNIPALHIMTGKDPTGTPPCAPAFMSNNRFYNAWNGPIYQINATDFGHMGVVDDDKGGLYKLACPKNKNKTAVDIYRNMVGNTVNTFINGLYNTDQDAGMKMLNTLKETSTFNGVNVILKQNNMEGMKYVRPGCTMV